MRSELTAREEGQSGRSKSCFSKRTRSSGTWKVQVAGWPEILMGTGALYHGGHWAATLGIGDVDLCNLHVEMQGYADVTRRKCRIRLPHGNDNLGCGRQEPFFGRNGPGLPAGVQGPSSAVLCRVLAFTHPHLQQRPGTCFGSSMLSMMTMWCLDELYVLSEKSTIICSIFQPEPAPRRAHFRSFPRSPSHVAVAGRPRHSWRGLFFAGCALRPTAIRSTNGHGSRSAIRMNGRASGDGAAIPRATDLHSMWAQHGFVGLSRTVDMCKAV